MSLDEIIEKLRSSMLGKDQFTFPSNLSGYLRGDGFENFSSIAMNRTKSSNYTSHNWNQHVKDWTNHLSGIIDEEDSTKRDAVAIFFYVLIIIISIFGNLLVCRVVFRRSAMRSTTNLFIGNLSVSDLLMTVLDIPFNVARLLMKDWPFGSFLCSSLPFVQVLSVYVSTFTMTCISLDRYSVIANPFKLKRRSYSARVKIVLIWVVAICLSIPYPLFSEVQEVTTYRTLHLCKVVYPDPVNLYRIWITVLTLLTQFLIPLAITGIAYIKIVYLVWYRQVVGAVTESQRMNQRKAKWKTIKMLIIVVVVFAICWMPVNIYHACRDFDTVNSPDKHKSNIFLLCHWIAMSSVCYNPFIYCWLNDTFRAVARSHIRWCDKSRKSHRSSTVSPPSRFDSRRSNMTRVLFRNGFESRYSWSQKYLNKGRSMRIATSSSMKSQDSVQSSFNSSSQKSPTTVTTFFPLETHVEGRNCSHGNLYLLSLARNRSWSSLQFSCKTETTLSRKSRSLEVPRPSKEKGVSETVV